MAGIRPWQRGRRSKSRKPEFSHRQHFPAGGLELLQVRFGLGLDVAADEWLGAAGAEGHPFPARQEKFVAVGGDEFFHRERADVLQSAAELGEQRVLFLRRKADVDAVGVKVADLFGKFLQNLAERFLFGGDQFGHQQAGEDAVLFRHVALHAQAAGFLAADDDRLALHQRADVFEADGRFMNLHAQHFRHGVHLMARGTVRTTAPVQCRFFFK